LVNMRDKNSYFPYLLMWLGFDYVGIPYVRKKRELGKSTYTFAKKIKAFIDSFVAFSYVPIRWISFMGLLLGTAAMLYGVVIIVGKLMGLVPISGWTSLMLVLLFVSSFQMIGLGIIGEYLWRTLDAVRNRPSYIIDKIVDQTPGKNGG